MKGFVRALAVAESSLGIDGRDHARDGLDLVDEARRQGLQVILLSDRTFGDLRPRGVLGHFDGVVAESGAALRVRTGPVRRTGHPESPRDGLLQVLRDLDVDPHDTLGVSPDGALLHVLEVAVTTPGAAAPADASTAADLALGAGGAEGLRRVLDEVRDGLPVSPPRHDVRLDVPGERGELERVAVPGAHANVLVCAVAARTGLPERLVARWAAAGYSVVVLDAAGRHPGARRVDVTTAGWVDQLAATLRGPARGAVVVDLQHEVVTRRSPAAAAAFAVVRAERRRSGRPHWLVVDPAGPALADPDLPPEALDLAATGHCLVVRDHEPVAVGLLGRLDVVLPCSPGCALPARRPRELHR